MACKVIQERIVDFHFDQLLGRQQQQMEEHLLQCRECLLYYLRFKSELAASRLGPLPSGGLRQQILTKARQPDGQGGKVQRNIYRRPVLWAVAAMFLLIMFLGLQHRTIGPGLQKVPAGQSTKPDQSWGDEVDRRNLLDSGDASPKQINLL